MYGLFESLELDQSTQRTSSRQATAIARKRVSDQFGVFIVAASDPEDAQSRLELIEDELSEVIAGVADEFAVDEQRLSKTVREDFLASLVKAPGQHTSSARLARKPKMCPYHSEVTDISVASGEPQAGFNAMAQHAWSNQHCQGGEYEGGKCNFKPAMTTQKFWDDKAERAEERREQRQEIQNLGDDIPTEVETPEPSEPDTQEEPEHEEFTEEPLEAPEPAEEAFSEPMAMAASTRMADVLEGLETDESKDKDKKDDKKDDDGPKDDGPSDLIDGFDPSGPAMKKFEELLPKILTYFLSEESGHEDPDIKELHDMLEGEKPGYMDAPEEEKPLDEPDAKAPEDVDIVGMPDDLEKEASILGFNPVQTITQAAGGVGNMLKGTVQTGAGVLTGNAGLIGQGVKDIGGGASQVGGAPMHLLPGVGLAGDALNDAGHKMEGVPQPGQQPVQDPNWKSYANVKNAEALKTIDVALPAGPEPKIDKSRWVPEPGAAGNLEKINTEMDGSPHPTTHQDIEEQPDYSKSFKDKTRAVTETEDASKRQNPTDGGGPKTQTWGGGDRSAVSSRQSAPEQQGHAQALGTHLLNLGPGARVQDDLGWGGYIEHKPKWMGAPPHYEVAMDGGRASRFEDPHEAAHYALGQGLNFHNVLGDESQGERQASVDPEKNPIREILEHEYDGFVPSSVIQSAISQHESGYPMVQEVQRAGFNPHMPPPDQDQLRLPEIQQPRMPEGVARLYEELDAARARGDRNAIAEIEQALENRHG